MNFHVQHNISEVRRLMNRAGISIVSFTSGLSFPILPLDLVLQHKKICEYDEEKREIFGQISDHHQARKTEG